MPVRSGGELKTGVWRLFARATIDSFNARLPFEFHQDCMGLQPDMRIFDVMGKKAQAIPDWPFPLRTKTIFCAPVEGRGDLSNTTA